MSIYSDLPKHIADLCGLLMEPAAPPKTALPKVAVPANPIQLVPNDDGTMTLTYFGKVVGWLNKTKLDGRESLSYRAMSIHGDIKFCGSVNSAKDWLLASHH